MVLLHQSTWYHFHVGTSMPTTLSSVYFHSHPFPIQTIAYCWWLSGPNDGSDSHSQSKFLWILFEQQYSLDSHANHWSILFLHIKAKSQILQPPVSCFGVKGCKVYWLHKILLWNWHFPIIHLIHILRIKLRQQIWLNVVSCYVNVQNF